MKNTSKKTKLLMAIVFLLTIIMSFSEVTIHIACALLLATLIVAHCMSNKKWLRGSTKAFFNGKLKSRTRKNYFSIVSLVTVLLITFASGLLLLTTQVSYTHTPSAILATHVIAAISGTIMSTLHAYRKIHNKSSSAKKKHFDHAA